MPPCPPRERKRIDEFILYGIAAADQAIAHSGWKAETDEQAERAGVLIGSGIGGLRRSMMRPSLLKERGPRKMSPVCDSRPCMINLISGQVSIRHGLKGPNHAVVTACSTGAHAIGDAARMIKYGDADMMVAGGAESAICRLGYGQLRAPRAPCRPASMTIPKPPRAPGTRTATAFVMGEGAGVVILEEYEAAKARGATIYAEVAGYGLSGDAFHITSPAEDGDGGFRSMSRRAQRARA
jgi:3-oxoacyl-[acyl-carrier-protein] synthase II